MTFSGDYTHTPSLTDDTFGWCRFNQGSLLGTFLDPLADKALLACTAVALGLQASIPATSGIEAHFRVTCTNDDSITAESAVGSFALITHGFDTCCPFASVLQGVLHPALVLLVVGRDAGLILGSFYYRAVTKKPGACVRACVFSRTAWRSALAIVVSIPYLPTCVQASPSFR